MSHPDSATARSGKPIKLDIVIPTYNRPRRLQRAVERALQLAAPEWRIVVIDDGSSEIERLDDGTMSNTYQLMQRYQDPRLHFEHKGRNAGLGEVFRHYVENLMAADYVLFVNDDDLIFDPQPLRDAVYLADSDPSFSIVYVSIARKSEDGKIDETITLPEIAMDGEVFFRRYTEVEQLRHTSIYGIFRTKFIRETGAMRPLGLQRYGLQDAFGIDTDLVFRLFTKGRIGFVNAAYLVRSETGGLTERFPLTFAYCYYQYVLRALRYMRSVGFADAADRRAFIKVWHKISLMMYSASIHSPAAEERGEERIRRHLRIPFHLYLLLHMAWFRIRLDPEDWALFRATWRYAWANRGSTLRYMFSPRRLHE